MRKDASWLNPKFEYRNPKQTGTNIENFEIRKRFENFGFQTF